MYIKDTSLLSSINADYFKLLFWKHRGKTKLVNCLNGMILINMSSLLDPISIISKSPSNAFIKSDNKCIWENHKCILSREKKKKSLNSGWFCFHLYIIGNGILWTNFMKHAEVLFTLVKRNWCPFSFLARSSLVFSKIIF